MTGYLKQFAELVTGYAHKYRYDPFFRTEINIVALQVLFAGILLAFVGLLAAQLYIDATSAVADGVQAALTPGTNTQTIGDSVIADIDAMRSRTIVVAAVVIMCVTGVFTYMIARLALAPTRNALASQKRFIGNIAHELRTPLSIIKTNTEVRLFDSDLSKEVRAMHRSTIEELDRISDTINNLLTLSAFIKPDRMEFREVDLGKIVENTLDKLKSLTEKRHTEIELRMSERRGVIGNPTALEQIVMNVVKNAILYTPREGNVRVSIEPVYPDFMELVIQDSGRGIARKDLFRVFEPYYRTDMSRQRVGGGSGLGLTIVSELVKLHNGKITVRSAEGRGTTITILLPASPIPPGLPNTSREQTDASEIAVDFSYRNRRKTEVS